MIEKKPTYDIASNQIEAFVQPIWSGALAKPFQVRDEDGRIFNIMDDHLSGKPLVLILLNNINQEDSLKVLKSFAKRRSNFDQKQSTVVAINANSDGNFNSSLKRDSGFSWPIGCDSGGSVFASFGLHKLRGDSVRIILLTPMRQIKTWFDSPSDIDNTVEEIMHQCDYSKTEQDDKWFPSHAPVLIIPNVLSPEECNQLIHSFETGGPFKVSPPSPQEKLSNYKMPIYEHNRQDRVDHIIKDPNTLAFLDQRMGMRVNPLVKKAFAFDITRREELHIARYVGARGGNQMGHRDNTSPATAYRRFAFSMNLNDNYEGGEVVFKEFNQHGYKTPPGTAIIFSSSLLHEVLETTKDTRYSLITHLFNDSTIPKR